MIANVGFFGTPAAAAPQLNPFAPKMPHFAGKAKRCIFLFMYGGPSAVDTFDYKPELQKRDGEEISIEIRRRSIQKQKLLASQRKFAQHGESGLWCSDAFPHISKHMDDLCVIKSLQADSFAHGSAVLQMNSGQIILGSPTLGSWMSYGLGSENQNLPSFVVMLDPRGGPISGAANWSSGYMPAAYQGTQFRSKGDPIFDLAPTDGMTFEQQQDQLKTLGALNADHLTSRPEFSELAARVIQDIVA